MEELVPYMRGWRGYFGFCETPEVLIALDSVPCLHGPWRANLRCYAILFDSAAADFAKIAKSWLYRGLTDLAPLSDLKPEIAGCLPALACTCATPD